MSLPPRKPKKQKRETRWRSGKHISHVKSFACCNCGSMKNTTAAHVRMESGAGMGQKPDDWRTAPLCDGPYSHADGGLGCHQRQHNTSEPEFWREYARRAGQSVWRLIDELCASSPVAREIMEVRNGPFHR